MGHYTNNIHMTSSRYSGFERMRVDVAQTSFFEGREFRTFKEIAIPASTTYVVKAVVPLNIILSKLGVSIESGELRLGTYVTGTEGGTFAEVLPLLPVNNMSLGVDKRKYNGIAYAPQVVLTAGGTHSGGVELDVIRLKTNSNTNQSVTVGGAASDERGVGAATYYFRLQNLSATDAIAGVFNARWEERPES